MTPLQTLEIRAGEIRTRLADLGAMTDMTDETRSELDRLRNEYTDNDRKRAALVIAGDVPGAPIVEGSEGRALRELLKRSSVGDVFGAVTGKRMVGATLELQEHYGLDHNQIPLSLLTRAEGDDLETRATGVTTAPTNVAAVQQSIIPAVFPDSVAAYLGVDMPTVGVGESQFPILITSADAGTPALDASQDETQGGFEAEALKPSRIQASFEFGREDAARFAGMSEALRQNLNDALMDKYDDEILSGTNGLLTATNLANHNVNTETTYALYRSQFAYGRVDGKYASRTADLRIVMGSGTYEHAAAQYRGNNDNMDALMALEGAVSGVRVSAHVPAVASTKQNNVIRLGMRRDMVAPIWEGIQLINDEVTQAKRGRLIITAVMLVAIKIVREAGFYKQQTQVA